MLLAESAPDPTALGTWISIMVYILLAICGVIVAIVHVLTYLRKGQPAPDTEFVTRGELARDMTRLETEVKDVRQYVNSEANRLETKIDDVKQYISVRTHDMANKIHVINLRIVWIMGVLAQLAGKQDGVSIPPEPMINTTDEA